MHFRSISSDFFVQKHKEHTTKTPKTDLLFVKKHQA